MTEANDRPTLSTEHTPQGAEPPQVANDGREWIPVPPPHPYGSAAPQPSGGKRALAIWAMAVGLVALLTTAVAAFYWSPFVLAGAFLGCVAVALGILAVVWRSRPVASGVTGIAAGALAILVAVATGGLALGAFLAPDGLASGSGSGSAPGTTPESDERDWTPDQQQESLIEWPANMETGGVIFEQGAGSGPVVRPSEPVAAGQAPTPPSVDRSGGPADILLYVDYRCPHCMDFEAANGAFLQELIDGGTATVEVVPLSFVDRAVSPLAAGAMACVVDGQPEAAWAAHTALFDPALREAPPTAGTLRAAIDSAAGGLDPAVADCIETGHFVTFVQALNQWATSNPVPGAVDASLMVRGTPLAVVNGVPYVGDPADAAAFARFVAEQIG